MTETLRASASGTNLPLVSDHNFRVVLDQIRRGRTGVTRAHLSAASGLSPQTISNLVGKLRADGWITESEPVHTASRGKPYKLLRPVDTAAYAVGVNIDPGAVSVALVSPSGKMIRREVGPAPTDFLSTLEYVRSAVLRVVEGTDPTKILGLGCSTPGPIAAETGVLLSSPVLPSSWGEIALRDEIRKVTGMRTFVQKDSIAAITAELWYRNRGMETTILYVYAGFGLGFAASHNGEIFAGASGNAGEVGHINVGMDSDTCSCGRRGCVGKIIEFEYVAKQALDAGILARSTMPTSQEELGLVMDEISILAASGDPTACALRQRSAEAISQATVVMADFLDATDIVLGGSNIRRLCPELLSTLETEIESYSSAARLHPVNVHVADCRDWAGTVGAAALVFDSEFSPHASKLTVAGP